MTNSGSSSSTSTRRVRGRVVGVPKICWCGSSIVELISKSDSNPFRRYYRCGYAAAQKLINDDHAFKWVDAGLLDEIEFLQVKNVRFEKELKEVSREREEFEQMVFEKVLMKVEKEVFERVEAVLMESSCNMKKMMILVIIGCMIMIGFSMYVCS